MFSSIFFPISINFHFMFSCPYSIMVLAFLFLFQGRCLACLFLNLQVLIWGYLLQFHVFYCSVFQLCSWLFGGDFSLAQNLWCFLTFFIQKIDGIFIDCSLLYFCSYSFLAHSSYFKKTSSFVCSSLSYEVSFIDVVAGSNGGQRLVCLVSTLFYRVLNFPYSILSFHCLIFKNYQVFMTIPQRMLL